MTNLSPILANLLLLFTIGFSLVAPESMWGVNHLQFLSIEHQVIFAFFAFLVLNVPSGIRNQIESFSALSEKRVSKYLITIFVTTLYGLLIWSFPIAVDVYGDSYKFADNYPTVITNSDIGWDSVLGLSLDAWAGQKTYTGLVKLVSFYGQINTLSSLRILGLIFGVCYAIVLVNFVLNYIKNGFSQVVFIVLGLFSPYTLIFFGRAEVYAFPLLTTLIWAILLVAILQNPSGWYGKFFFVLVFFLNVKAHPVAILTLPATVLSLAYSASILTSKIRPQSLLAGSTIFIFISGVLAYFFVFEDHIDNRAMQQVVMQYDHLFLPLFSPEAPLDMYNLLSINHISDFVNLYFLIAPGVTVLFVVVIATSASFDFTKSALLSTVLLYSALYFGINPLLGMPIDWDLFSPVAPLMFVFLVYSIRGIKLSVLSFAISVTILMTSFFVLHNSTDRIALRLLSLTQHIHQTYYAWTNILTERAMSLHQWDSNDYESILINHISELESHSIQTVDVELSQIQKNFGKWYLREQENPRKAENKFLTALTIDPNNWNAQLLITEALYLQRKYSEAYVSAKSLQRYNRPDKNVQVLKMMIDCAEQAELYKEALEASILLVATDPTEEHRTIKSNIEQRIKNIDKQD